MKTTEKTGNWRFPGRSKEERGPVKEKILEKPGRRGRAERKTGGR